MNIYFDRIKPLFDQTGLNVQQLAKEIGLSARDIYHWNNDGYQTYTKYVVQIAKYFNVSADYLLGETDDPTPAEKLRSPNVTEDIVSFPVIGGVAAGYDHIAYENWTGDSVDIPRSYLKGRKPQDYFVLRVEGDSMYPDFQNGDHVLVLRQSTMDRSGQVGVVIYGDEHSSLKRIEYVMGEDWMTLRPINPQYPPVTIRDEDLEHCRVLGVAKLVIRELTQ